jgi:hypothetical protein
MDGKGTLLTKFIYDRMFRYFPVFRASWPLKLNYPKNQAFSSEKLAILGVPR